MNFNKRGTVSFGAGLSGTQAFPLWKEFTPTWNQSTARIPLQSSDGFALFSIITEKPVFECAFAHPIMLFLLYFVKVSMDRVSVICKLAMKSYAHVPADCVFNLVEVIFRVEREAFLSWLTKLHFSLDSDNTFCPVYQNVSQSSETDLFRTLPLLYLYVIFPSRFKDKHQKVQWSLKRTRKKSWQNS